MKATGVVRKVDELGRIVLPIELRRTMDVAIKDPLEIFTEGSNIILRKYLPACVICGEANDTKNYMGKLICKNCVDTSKTLV